jgi:threonine dehydrogenase-like Zn-dependent dehydrogenase
MKAIIFHARPVPGQTAPGFLPGLSQLEQSDVPAPDLPRENWVVVKSRIAGICGSDLGFLQGKAMPALAPYLRLPIIPGHELFGEVEAVGKEVVIVGLPAVPDSVDWTPVVSKELRVIGSMTYGDEMFEGERRNTFARAVQFLTTRRADLTSIKPCKFPLTQYREAPIEAAGKRSFGRVNHPLFPNLPSGAARYATNHGCRGVNLGVAAAALGKLL